MNLSNHLNYDHHALREQIEQYVYYFVLKYSADTKLDLPQDQLKAMIHQFYLHLFLEKGQSLPYQQPTSVKPDQFNRLPNKVFHLVEMIFRLTQLIRKHEKKKIHFGLKNPEEIYRYFYHLKFLNQETMKAVYLSYDELLETKDLFLGGRNSILITPKEVIAPAIKLDAEQLILVHNHPSGETTPSEKDFEFTRKIDLLCSKLGITLLDHVVIGNDFFSFKQEGFL